jgi:hypothetical protein
MAVEVYRMAYLATVVPIVRETEQSAWMKHASVVLTHAHHVDRWGEPRSGETESAPVRIRWVRQSDKSLTGVGSRETGLQQPSPFEAHRDPQPQPIRWAKPGPPYRRGLPRRRGVMNPRTRTAICRGHQEDFAKSANFRSRIRLPITLDRAGCCRSGCIWRGSQGLRGSRFNQRPTARRRGGAADGMAASAWGRSICLLNTSYLLPQSRARVPIEFSSPDGHELTGALRASVRRHRRAQGDRSTLRSIRPTRAVPKARESSEYGCPPVEQLQNAGSPSRGGAVGVRP